MLTLTDYTSALRDASSDLWQIPLTRLNDRQRDLLCNALGFIAENRIYWEEMRRSAELSALCEAHVEDRRVALVYLAYVYADMPDYGLQYLLRDLLARDDAVDGACALQMLSMLIESDYDKDIDHVTPLFVEHLQKLYKNGALQGHEGAIRSYMERNTKFWSKGREPRVLEARLRQMLGASCELRLPFGDYRLAWIDELQADFAELPGEDRAVWMSLIDHGLTASGSSPSAAWLKTASKIAGALTAGTFSQTLARWYTYLCRYELGSSDEVTLKAMIWLAGIGEPKLLAPGLGDMAVCFYTKVQWLGPRSRIAGNACIQILCLLAKPGVVQLSRLRSRVRYSQGKNLIERSVVKAAERAGLTPDDMEEASVPDMGFNTNGVACFEFGGASAQLRLDGEGRLISEWHNAAGKVLKSVPAEVKRDHGEAFKQWQKHSKEFANVIQGQRLRLEQAFIRKRTWRFEDWHQRFIHSTELLGWMGRRLIWNLECPTGMRQAMGLDGKLTDIDGNALGDLPADTLVTLWHPIQSNASEVLRWRDTLQRLQVQQPIRQAFREVYLLTDAERASGSQSRRFADHLLRQFQLNALLNERGWSYRLQGSWDGHNDPYKVLQNWGLSVLFQLQANESFSSIQGDTGVYAYVESGEFWFSRVDGGELTLAEVPELVFSEILRDMDLFIGVCSVGNDPELAMVDDPAFQRYISLASHCELEGGAQVRRDLLGDILSRLPIAKRCRLEGRYLVVAGDLRTYRIHLGSSNILMEPNNQYLCIVQDRKSKSAASGIYLPFEGDALLSLILSKALLLANDKKIKDPSILSQIGAL